MAGKNGPPPGVGNFFPLWKEGGGGGPRKAEKNFSALYPFFNSDFPLHSLAGRLSAVFLRIHGTSPADVPGLNLCAVDSVECTVCAMYF